MTAINDELKEIHKKIDQLLIGNKDFLTVAESAIYMGVSKSWVYANLKNVIDVYFIGTRTVFKKEDINDFIEGGKGLSTE